MTAIMEDVNMLVFTSQMRSIPRNHGCDGLAPWTRPEEAVDELRTHRQT